MTILLLTLLAATAICLPLAAAPGEARVWCHLCPWNALNNLSHSRRDFPLGLGMATHPGLSPRPEPQGLRDCIYECQSAAAGGIDAFALDLIVSQPLRNWLPAVDGYLKAAETVSAESGRPFYATPCLDGPGARSAEELADYLQELLSGRSASPAWPRLEGLPVVWTYAGTSLPAAKWASVFALLKARGVDLAVVLDANSLFAQARPAADGNDPWSGLPTGELDALAALPVALYAFRTDFDRRTQQRCLAYLQARHPQSLAARLPIGTVWPGYWSLGSGWYVDPRGTGLIRDSFAHDAAAQWLTVTTWNDFYETTHFQPSLGFGTGRLDLLHALLSRWRGEEPWPREPRLYLWQPNELQVGEPVRGEVLALLPAAAPMQVRVSLCGRDGAVAREGAWTELAAGGVATSPFELGPSAAPPGTCQYLLLEYRLPGREVRGCLSQPICVWPAGYHPLATRRGTLWRVGAQEPGPQAVRLDTADGPPTRIVTSWPEGAVPAGSRLHVRQNFSLIHFPGEAPSPVQYDLDTTYGQGRAAWEVYPPLPPRQRWGFFDTVLVLPDGSLRWSDPVWVAPAAGSDLQCAGLWHLDEGTGGRASDASPYAHDATLSGDPHWEQPGRVGTGCLRFDGEDDCLNIPGGRFPRGDFTVSAWVRPESGAAPATRCLYVDINGCVILALDERGRLTCSRATDGGWAAAVSAATVAPGVWTYVAATYDQQRLRLYVNGTADGEAPCAGTRASNVTAIGCNPFGSRSGFFAGCLDEVKVVARAETPEVLRAQAAAH